MGCAEETKRKRVWREVDTALSITHRGEFTEEEMVGESSEIDIAPDISDRMEIAVEEKKRSVRKGKGKGLELTFSVNMDSGDAAMTGRPSGEFDLNRLPESSVARSFGPTAASPSSSGEGNRPAFAPLAPSIAPTPVVVPPLSLKHLRRSAVAHPSHFPLIELNIGSPGNEPRITGAMLAALRWRLVQISKASDAHLAIRNSYFALNNASTSSSTANGAVRLRNIGQSSTLITTPSALLPYRPASSFRRKLVAPAPTPPSTPADRKMDPKAFRVMISSDPSEIIVPDCSLLPEQIFMEAFAQRTALEMLEVLDLGFCGGAMSDGLCAQLVLPNLRTLILSGAHRLTDKGLAVMLRKVPNLRRLKLIQCTAISAASIWAVAESRIGPALKTLSLESCSQLHASAIKVPLQKLVSLESLSLSGISTGMNDKIITELTTRLGFCLRELSIAGCSPLTDGAIQAISSSCPDLRVLDIGRLPRLTDQAIRSLAAGRCRRLTTLRLTRGNFSDGALAAMINRSGGHLKELSLSCVRRTGTLTLAALALNSADTLEKLDLSFCQAVSDHALGFLTDRCEALREIKLFGCVHVKRFFLDGYSHPVVNRIGNNQS